MNAIGHLAVAVFVLAFAVGVGCFLRLAYLLFAPRGPKRDAKKLRTLVLGLGCVAIGCLSMVAGSWLGGW
jgi:hypothetical protein